MNVNPMTALIGVKHAMRRLLERESEREATIKVAAAAAYDKLAKDGTIPAGFTKAAYVRTLTDDPIAAIRMLESYSKQVAESTTKIASLSETQTKYAAQMGVVSRESTTPTRQTASERAAQVNKDFVDAFTRG